MSEKRLQVLVRKFLIPLAKNESLFSCDHCLFRKQHNIFFSSRSKKNLEKLGLVYYDICGPMDVNTLRGNMYFITFIDDAIGRYEFICSDKRIKSFGIFYSFIPWLRERLEGN